MESICAQRDMAQNPPRRRSRPRTFVPRLVINHPNVLAIQVTLVTTILCFLNPYTRMGGTELVYNLFAECRTGSGNTHSGLCVIDPGSFEHVLPVVRAILIAMVVKGALTIVTFGIKVPAGIFIPTLGVGACAGRVLGIGMQWLQLNYPNSRTFDACKGDLDCLVPGLYAMVGAAATLSGVTVSLQENFPLMLLVDFV
jgi:chloride channel 3/4/5